MEGSTPAVAEAATRPSTLRPRSSRESLVAQDHGGGPVHDARGVPRRLHAVLGEDGAETRELFGARLAGMLVPLQLLHFLGEEDLAGLKALAFQRARDHGHDLFRKPPRLLRREGSLLAAQGVGVGLLSRDAVLLGEVLGRLAHAEVDRRVQELGGEGVHEVGTAHLLARAAAVGGDRVAGHALGSTAEDGPGLAEGDLLGSRDDGLEPAPADALDEERRPGLGYAGVEPHVPGEVEGVGPALGHVGEDDLIDLLPAQAALYQEPHGPRRCPRSVGFTLAKAPMNSPKGVRFGPGDDDPFVSGAEAAPFAPEPECLRSHSFLLRSASLSKHHNPRPPPRSAVTFVPGAAGPPGVRPPARQFLFLVPPVGRFRCSKAFTSRVNVSFTGVGMLLREP